MSSPRFMSTDGVSIREVYQLSQRIEDKIDEAKKSNDKRFSGIEQRISIIEGKTAGVAAFWSILISVAAIVIDLLIRQKI